MAHRENKVLNTRLLNGAIRDYLLCVCLFSHYAILRKIEKDTE